MTFERRFRDRDEADNTWDEPVDKSKDQVNVTLDPESRADVEAIKDALDIKSDAKAIKIGLEAGKNAIFTSFRVNTLKYLASKNRVRKSDYNKNGELKSKKSY